MGLQDETPSNIEVSNYNRGQDNITSVFEAIWNATPPPPPSSNVNMHRVPRTTREKDKYDKYYVPQVVSIGPYHFGNPKVEQVEKLKPVFAKKLLSNDEETLKTLCARLGEPKVVQELRDMYEENSTNEFGDEAFTKMMLLDACFILYYIQSCGWQRINHLELDSHQTVFIRQDLFLLENQIPFKVIKVVMNVMPSCLDIKPFIDVNMLLKIPERSWSYDFMTSFFGLRKDQRYKEESKEELFKKAINECDHLLHLLHLLHHSLTKNSKIVPNKYSMNQTSNRYTFRNVSEFLDLGISFKPSNTMAQIGFLDRPWLLDAIVQLPPISVDGSSKPIWLNLIAYETTKSSTSSSSNFTASHDEDSSLEVVISYICLLRSLIFHPDDVRILRNSGVIKNLLGSDEEIVKLFNEIGPDLVPVNTSFTYWNAMSRIQELYELRRNSITTVVTMPWRYWALVGVLTSIGLSAVQTYFTFASF